MHSHTLRSFSFKTGTVLANKGRQHSPVAQTEQTTNHGVLRPREDLQLSRALRSGAIAETPPNWVTRPERVLRFQRVP
jgi:hypothetical protein